MVSGAYFHPLVAQDTVDFFQHFAPIVFTEEFTLDTWIQIIPSDVAPVVAAAVDRISVGSVISGNTIRLYRSNGSMLSSVTDFWPGRVGYQTFVWMAVCDDVAVWTQSGTVYENWLDRNGDITNSHLPASILQESNVALIVYQPYSPIRSESNEVALYWPMQRFDNVTTVIPENSSDMGSPFLGSILGWLIWVWQLIFGAPSPLGSWVLGQRNDSYIAVYCPCDDRTVMGWYSCGGDQGRQVWVTVVGDASRHNSFADFTAVIQDAVVKDTSPSSWSRRSPNGGSIYSVTVTVDSKTITHKW